METAASTKAESLLLLLHRKEEEETERADDDVDDIDGDQQQQHWRQQQPTSESDLEYCSINAADFVIHEEDNEQKDLDNLVYKFGLEKTDHQQQQRRCDTNKSPTFGPVVDFPAAAATIKNEEETADCFGTSHLRSKFDVVLAAGESESRQEVHTFRSQICQKQYRTEKTLLTHRKKSVKQKRKSAPKTSKFICPDCQKGFASETALKMHTATGHKNQRKGFRNNFSNTEKMQNAVQEKGQNSELAGESASISTAPYHHFHQFPPLAASPGAPFASGPGMTFYNDIIAAINRIGQATENQNHILTEIRDFLKPQERPPTDFVSIGMENPTPGHPEEKEAPTNSSQSPCLPEDVILDCLTASNKTRSKFLKYLLERLIPEKNRIGLSLSGPRKSGHPCPGVHGQLNKVVVRYCENIVYDRIPLTAQESATDVTIKATKKHCFNNTNQAWKNAYCKSKE